MSQKQCRYESFLDGVQKREDAAILRAVPAVLAQFVDLIKEAGAIVDHPNWEAKTLPKLRLLYAEARDTKDAQKALKAIEEMAHEFGGWFRRLPWRVVIKKTYVNDSRNHDPKASRINSIAVVKEERTPANV